MPSKIPTRVNIVFDWYWARLFERSILTNSPLLQNISASKLMDFALYVSAHVLNNQEKFWNQEIIIKLFTSWISEEAATTSVDRKQIKDEGTKQVEELEREPMSQKKPLRDFHINENPWVNNIEITLAQLNEQPSTHSVDQTRIDPPSANTLRYISLPDNLDIKRIYRAKLNQWEDIEYRTKFFEDNNFKRNHFHSISKDEPIHLHPNQGPAKILVWLYQHTKWINEFAITAVNMETMKMYDSLKTSSTKSTQYGAANTIISLPLEEALSLINNLQSIRNSNTRDDNFSWRNLAQDWTPYEFRLPNSEELIMQNPNQNNKPVLVYCKRFHPVTKQWTYGHVLFEAEEKYLHQIKDIDFNMVEQF